MLHVHLGALHRVDHRIGGVVRAVAALCRSPEPVILLCGHEHKLAASKPGYLHRLPENLNALKLLGDCSILRFGQILN